MGFFKSHPKLSALLVFISITIPNQIDTCWSLYEKFKGVSMPSLNLGSWIWLLPVIGGVFAIIIIRQGHQKKETGEAGKKPRIFRSLLMLSDRYTHKCSQCGFGVVVGKYDTGVICPKCGNADDIIPRL